MGQDLDIDGWMEALGPYEPEPVVAIAVSGGGDSMALAWLLFDWVRHRNGRLQILSVDHGLRADSSADCTFVRESFAGIKGVSHLTLVWEGCKPQTGIQAAAREARYGLLTAHCRAEGILHLCVAHTMDDQAETYAIREGRGSGLRGLASMPALRQLDGVRLLRPLLRARREDLRTYLKERGKAWREDPSNQMTRFERIRHRAVIDETGTA